MAELKTSYMGIELKNPIIAGASDLTADMDKIKKIEQAGAGALVIKSLFEEQIQLEMLKFEQEMQKYDYLHAEMETIFPNLEHAGPKEHLNWVRKAKESVKIPVIASLNAVNRETWIEYATRLADTGVDGLELNFYASPSDFAKSSAEIEQQQIDTLAEIRKAVKIPVSVKLSPFYTNPLHFIKKLDEKGVDGFVLFNQLFQPDIDPEKEENTFPFNWSVEKESRLPLRFIGLLHGQVKASLCASTGIFTGKDVAKMILAGADVVQIVSVLFQKGISSISEMVKELEQWMEKHGYQSLADFRGKMSKENSNDPWVYKRAQYVKLLLRNNPLANL